MNAAPTAARRRTRCGGRAILAALLALSIGGVASTPAAGQTRRVCTITADTVAGHVDEASRRFGVPASWIRAVMRVESAGNPCAVSHAGAMGLMQIMPGTWAGLRRRHGLGADPFDPRDNVLAGTAYLREMHDRYGPVGMLAAYNAGPGRWEDFRSRRRPLPRETVAYLTRLSPVVGGSIQAAEAAPITAHAAPDPFAWRGAGLFPSSRAAASDVSGGRAARSSDSAPPTPAPSPDPSAALVLEQAEAAPSVPQPASEQQFPLVRDGPSSPLFIPLPGRIPS